jgi:hypothetical protein
MQKSRPNISKTAFWDVNFEEIDFDKNYVFVVDKVFNYGKFNDQLELIRFYGVENIKKMMVQVPYFRKEVFAFICGYFQLNPTEFKCYLRRQSNPTHWEF